MHCRCHSCVYVALRKSIHFREIYEWAFTDGVTTFVNMWLCCRQALIFWLNNFDYFTVWCLLLLCHLKRKLFKSTIMPVEVLMSIVKDWYEWFVSGLVHLLSNDPFRRTGLMPCRKKQAYMNKLTTKKQMQTWWALVGARSKLRSKVKFFSILCHFHASLTLCANVEKLQKRVGSGTQTTAPIKQT